MSFKRQVDRLPIVPPDAVERNVVCHFCIVGCGYKAYTWPSRREGGRAPSQNKFGADLRVQQGAESPTWYPASMYNLVKQNGQDAHLVLMPDAACVVNSGLGSIRGARMAELSYSAQRGTQRQRLTDPLVWRYGQLQPTSWDDALSLAADVTARVIAERGDDGLVVSAFDHGGAGGGYENTWGTGKLYFEALKVKNIRIHNRPAYNSEVHATRDMGVGELNNCYEDAELADTIMVVGANPLETQTNYFLNHWVPNLRGLTDDKKAAAFKGETPEPSRIIIVDPRRTVTVNACEFEAGRDRVLHLAIKSGTDLALFNGLLTYIVEQGWIDRPFIDASTEDFDAARAASRLSLGETAEITGVPEATLAKAAAWIAQPKAGGARRRAMFAYEKGLIWGNDNYRTNAALVNLALATGNVGRPGGGCVRLGGHQEGYVRPDYPGARPAVYIDRLLMEGGGGVHHVWACDHYKTTLDAMAFKRAYKRRTDIVKDAINGVAYGDRKALVDVIVDAIRRGGLFVVDVDIVPTKIGEAAHVILPAATSGEMNLTSMNGERRMRLTERYMDPPGQAKPDCLIAAALAQHLARGFAALGMPDRAKAFEGFAWATEEDAFMDGYHRHAKGGEHVTYARLRALGTNGFQEPAIGVSAERIVGTQRLYADGKFDRPNGRAQFLGTPWRGLQAAGKAEQKARFAYLINNGRANHVWQSAYLDQASELIIDRSPYPYVELHPDDMADLGVAAGDLVEIHNDVGSTQAMAYPTPTARRKEAFMVFAHPLGVQGNVVSGAVNELLIPNYKQTWADIRRIAAPDAQVAHVSFKSFEIPVAPE